MMKSEVIERFCKLSASVGSNVFKEEEAHDCFCFMASPYNSNFQFSEEVIEFIEMAVAKEISKLGVYP